jgi:hypothetical protein
MTELPTLVDRNPEYRREFERLEQSGLLEV